MAIIEVCSTQGVCGEGLLPVGLLGPVEGHVEGAAVGLAATFFSGSLMLEHAWS